MCVCLFGKGGSWLAVERSVANKLSEVLVYVGVGVGGWEGVARERTLLLTSYRHSWVGI